MDLDSNLTICTILLDAIAECRDWAHDLTVSNNHPNNWATTLKDNHCIVQWMSKRLSRKSQGQCYEKDSRVQENSRAGWYGTGGKPVIGHFRIASDQCIQCYTFGIFSMRLQKLLDTKIHTFFKHNSLPINMAETKLLMRSQHCPKKKRQFKQFGTVSQTLELHAWSTH
mgnify:FL=1